MSLAKALFCLTFFVFPYYVFPSGGFHIAHAALLAMFAIHALDRGRSLKVSRAAGAHLALVGYMVSVNLAWYLIDPKADFVVSAIVYGMVGFIFVSCQSVCADFDRRDARVFLQVVFATLCVQLLLIGLGLGRPSYRTIVYFNNPNQLGYFAAVSAAMAVVVGHVYGVRGYLIPAITLLAFALAAFSLSKGGMAACFLYVVMALAFGTGLNLRRQLLLVTALVVLGVAASGPIVQTEFYERIDRRLNGFQAGNDDSLDARGYGRIVDHPQYLVLGAGEGHYERFRFPYELHSWPASTLFCYGAVGLALLVNVLRTVIPSATVALMLVPLLVYNLTHNGGRSLVLWMLLALIASGGARTLERARARNVSARRSALERLTAPTGVLSLEALYRGRRSPVAARADAAARASGT